MALQNRHANLFSGFVALILLLDPGVARLAAQTGTPCVNTANASSFEFPLWSDSLGWKMPNVYTSIQLADIDGDGQDELLGKGPSGIEVWHWEFHGQAWVQLPYAGPAIPATDTMMTADVDGDGQAEIIQITPNLGSNPVVNVWHFDGAANPALAAGPGFWRLQPQLRLTLTPSVGSNSTALPPIVQFARLGSQSSKQQQLVSMAIRVTPGLVYYTPFAYQVNATQTGWTTVGQGPMTDGGGTFSNAFPGLLQIGDVTGDGLSDLVLLEGTGNFLVFPQVASSAPGNFGFSHGIQAGPDSGGTFSSYTFALGDAASLGYDQIYTVEHYNNSTSQDLKGYQFTAASGLSQVSLLPADSANAGTVQIAYTGNNPVHPKGASILILFPDGLDEYAGNFGRQEISNTPFISQARFGDDPSHYKIIQTGTVMNSSGSAAETILVARDASGIHTLIPASAQQICNATSASFILPQYTYFPQFTPNQSVAYNDISQILTGTTAAGQDLRSQYKNTGFPAVTDHGTVSGLSYPATANPVYSRADFAFVQAQLLSELEAVGQAQTYYQNGSSSASMIFAGAQSQFNIALDALSLPADASPADNLVNMLINLPLQGVYAITEFIGNANIPEASQIAEAISVVTEIIDDVQQATTPPPTTLASQTLVVNTQISNWNNTVKTANSNANLKITQNWDLLSTLSQRINAGLIDTTAADLNSSQNQAINAFAVGFWQVLAPQVWSIYGLDNYDSFTASGPLAGYPYLQSGTVASPNYSMCRVATSGGVRGPTTFTYYPNYLVYPKVTSSSDAGFAFGLPPPPVPAAAMAQLAMLGVDYHDVLAGRNGWQIPQDTTNWCYNVPAFPISADAPAPAGPAPGAPGQLVVGGGESVGTIQCAVNGDANAPLNQQSTPINSVFPEPVSVKVYTLSDVAGQQTPVPGATVQITGAGLSPATSTVVTDLSGSASFALLANSIVQGPYTASIQVVSPAPNASAPSCALTVPYQLINGPSASGTTPVTSDVQSVVSVTSKGQIFTTDRRWNFSIIDPTGIATGGVLTGAQLTQTRGSASCKPISVIGGAPLTQVQQITGGTTEMPVYTPVPGQFTSLWGWDFSSCTGLNVFRVQLSGTFTIPTFDGGAPYNASFSATINNQTP